MRELCVTDTAVGERVQVRIAQANRCYANEGLAPTRGRPELLSDTHISHREATLTGDSAPKGSLVATTPVRRNAADARRNRSCDAP
jgi:hypothetical protein